MLNARLSIVSLVLVATTSLHAQSCDKILERGVFDQTHVKNSVALKESWMNWLFAYYSSNESSITSDSVGLEAVSSYGKGFGTFDADSEEIRQLKIAYSRYLSGERRYLERINHFTSKASPILADAWEKCMSRLGLQASYAVSANPSEVIVSFRYNPFHPKSPEKIKVELEQGDDATCEGAGRNGKLEISVEGQKTARCKLKDGKKAGTVRLSTKWRGDLISAINLRVLKIPKLFIREARRAPTNALAVATGGGRSEKCFYADTGDDWQFLMKPDGTIKGYFNKTGGLTSGDQWGYIHEETDSTKACYFVDGYGGSRLEVIPQVQEWKIVHEYYSNQFQSDP